MKTIVFIIIIIILVVCGCFFTYNYKINVADNGSYEDVTFKIESGEGVKKIAANLFDQKLINSEFFFLLYVKNQKKEADFQAGEYILNQVMPIKKIVSVLTNGQAISKERTIKIIEGWRINDIGEYLEKQDITTQARFENFAKAKIAKWNFDFSKPEFIGILPQGADLEGFLFPDTYRIFQNAKETDIIEKMLGNFSDKLTPDIIDGIAQSGHSLYEIITMASIIQKEVRGYDDMRVVSGLFWDRIK